MNRKLKALGAALLAAMAFSAVAVVSAPAEDGGHFVADEDPATIDATELGDSHVFTASGIAIECTHTTFEAPNDPAQTETEVTIVPVYTDCYLGAHESANEVQVTMNSCDFNFTVSTEPAVDNTVHVDCENGDAIEIHTSILGNCTLDIPAQTVGGVSYANTGDDITVDIASEGITYARTSTGLFGCKNLLGAHGTDGKYTGEATVAATDEEENVVNVDATG